MTLIIICGPTATGKSDLAVDLALAINGEIINADSMQLYRGMDIGTAKLSLDERRGVPHHLLDILDVSQDASVADYQGQARQLISDIEDRNRVPIVVGGTGLYIKSIVDEMNFPETDPEIRTRLESEGEIFGAAELFQRLHAIDPVAAEKIEPTNIRRIIRALEVIEITGQPYSANLPADESSLYPDALHFGLAMSREELASRISTRIEVMWNKGLVAEVEDLVERGIRDGVTAQRAIGYAQVLSSFDGTMTEEQAKEETIVATRQYVRRQETWFKRDQRITWLSPEVNRLEKILAALD